MYPGFEGKMATIQLEPNQLGQWLVVTWSQNTTYTIACVLTEEKLSQSKYIRVEVYVASVKRDRSCGRSCRLTVLVCSVFLCQSNPALFLLCH